jgi:YfiH family protein
VDKNPEVIAAVSERSDGDLRPGQVAATAIFLERLGIKTDHLVRMEQVHGGRVVEVGRKAIGTVVPGVDGILTGERGVWLGVKVADCEPVLIYDRRQKIVGAIHAGWRGNVQAIIPKTIALLKSRFHTLPRDLFVYVGPSLGPCHARFSDSSSELPPAWRRYVVRRSGRAGWVDFWQATRDQFLSAGVPDAQIEIAGICTQCFPKRFFSYRADGKILGEQLGIIGIKS